MIGVAARTGKAHPQVLARPVHSADDRWMPPSVATGEHGMDVPPDVVLDRFPGLDTRQGRPYYRGVHRQQSVDWASPMETRDAV